MTSMTVLGELVDDLAAEFRSLEMDAQPDGLCEFRGRVPLDGALMRACFRAEAELLLDDTAAMAAGRWVHRTPEQRRVAAFALVTTRLTAGITELLADEPGAGPETADLT
jgi:hypothetical protein